MNFYFDQEIDRKGTNSIKWEFLFEDGVAKYGDHTDPKHGADRLLPLFVADMDFRTVPQVIEALTQRAVHGVFGYGSPDDVYFEALCGWFKRRYNWEIQPEWVEITPGVVASLNLAVQQFTEPGDKVLIQRPVYHPFSYAIENNGREIVSNELVLENGRYQMDFNDLAEKVADPDLKLAILCSPHNPIGRVWTKEELTQFGQLCIDNNVLVVSDEIHCDLIFSDYEFVSFATISDAFAQNSITCTAPSKTFNLAGLKTSNIIIPNPELLAQYQTAISRNGLYGKNAFGLIATQTAYQYGDAWLSAVITYIEENYNYMADFLATHLPEITITPLEGTYLAWVDFRALNLEQLDLAKLLREEAKLILNSGDMFGPAGTGFMRFNLACHRSILVTAMQRLQRAVSPLLK